MKYKLFNLNSLYNSYKISIEDAQNKTMKDGIKNILKYNNEINNVKFINFIL